MNDSAEAIARDIAAIRRNNAVPSLLRIICQNTGMGFAAVARVTDGTWTACAVQDNIQFGLEPGGQLAVETTLCSESRAARRPVVIDQASLDPVYRDHHTPRLYNIESYISVPIILSNGDYFGNLCAIDPRPARVSDPAIVTMFTLFAEVIAKQLENEEGRQAAESALQTERATAELREQFVAVLGHDLRNPLAAIGAAAEVLLRRRDDEKLVSMGQRLRSSTRRMARLIEDVMDFTRGRLGSGISLQLTDVADMSVALKDVVVELCEANRDRVVIDRIAFDGTVFCDRGRLQQLLSNLLGNALTYGAADHPVVVEAKVEDEMLILSVSNRGEPIAAKDLERVFEPYWRPATSTPGGGLGLGLFICLEIAKSHGGTLAVDSSAADGTRFVARIPTFQRS
jgi:signal transduction histidine kinase